MLEFTKIKKVDYTLYEFNELKPSARKRVISNWQESNPWLPEDITQELLEELNSRFANSVDNLSVQWDLSCCQGSGLNIFGQLEFEDVKDFFADIFQEPLGACKIELDENIRYTYSLKHNQIFPVANALSNEIESFYSSFYGTFEVTEEGFEILTKNVESMMNYLEKFEKKLYDLTESIYYPDDETFQDICMANDWLFDEMGFIVNERPDRTEV
jgi:hypothetical protein